MFTLVDGILSKQLYFCICGAQVGTFPELIQLTVIDNTNVTQLTILPHQFSHVAEVAFL